MKFHMQYANKKKISEKSVYFKHGQYGWAGMIRYLYIYTKGKKRSKTVYKNRENFNLLWTYWSKYNSKKVRIVSAELYGNMFSI